MVVGRQVCVARARILHFALQALLLVSVAWCRVFVVGCCEGQPEPATEAKWEVRTIFGAQYPLLHGKYGVNDLLLLRPGHGNCESDSPASEKVGEL